MLLTLAGLATGLFVMTGVILTIIAGGSATGTTSAQTPDRIDIVVDRLPYRLELGERTAVRRRRQRLPRPGAIIHLQTDGLDMDHWRNRRT